MSEGKWSPGLQAQPIEIHAKAGHIIDITSVPMRCTTCDIPDDPIEEEFSV